MMEKDSVVCFGEILWDVLPSGRKPGGAPMNVGVHLSTFGHEVAMISRVGKDLLGDELVAFLREKGIHTDEIQRDPGHPTGEVQVSLDEQGHACYEIVMPVAWDFIDATANAQQWVRTAGAFVYGSLAARNERSHDSLTRLLPLANLRIFDVNLRPPFYQADQILAMLSEADWIKMNEDELPMVASWISQAGENRAMMAGIKARFDLAGVVLTQGKEGASLLDDTGFYRASGFPVTVVDTIGSGDGFLAAFIHGLLRGLPPETRLAYACAMGGMVAAHAGATPAIRWEDLTAFIAASPSVI